MRWHGTKTGRKSIYHTLSRPMTLFSLTSYKVSRYFLLIAVIAMTACRSHRVAEDTVTGTSAGSFFHTNSGQVIIIRKPSLSVPISSMISPPSDRVRHGFPMPSEPCTADTTFITWSATDTAAATTNYNHRARHDIQSERSSVSNVMREVLQSVVILILLVAIFAMLIFLIKTLIIR